MWVCSRVASNYLATLVSLKYNSVWRIAVPFRLLPLSYLVTLIICPQKCWNRTLWSYIYLSGKKISTLCRPYTRLHGLYAFGFLTWNWFFRALPKGIQLWTKHTFGWAIAVGWHVQLSFLILESLSTPSIVWRSSGLFLCVKVPEWSLVIDQLLQQFLLS